MKATIDCVHCYLKQAVTFMKLAGLDEDKQHEIIYQLMDYVKGFNINSSPAENSTKILHKTSELTGVNDPYADAKKRSNDMALEMYPELKRKLETSQDRLYDALKLASAGNIIDLGVNRSFDIDEALNYSMNKGFAKDHYDEFVKKLKTVPEVLIIGDNSGEIVFDKILVEELVSMGKKVTFVVKERPVLNDATMEDAVYVGMDKIAKVVTTGSGYIGVCMDKASPEFLTMLKKAELAIAKGQGNFESLEDQELAKDKIYFLLKVKCDEVARVSGARFGDVVFFRR